MADMVAEAQFDDLIAQLLQYPGVTPPSPGRGFGSSALRVDGRIFAMLVRGHLVLKLPESHIDTLLIAGEGKRFDANKGTPMREWFALDPGSQLSWLELARNAMTFVKNHHRGPKDRPAI